jgi:hypothetical protein
VVVLDSIISTANAGFIRIPRLVIHLLRLHFHESIRIEFIDFFDSFDSIKSLNSIESIEFIVESSYQ